MNIIGIATDDNGQQIGVVSRRWREVNAMKPKRPFGEVRQEAKERLNLLIERIRVDAEREIGNTVIVADMLIGIMQEENDRLEGIMEGIPPTPKDDFDEFLTTN